MVARTLRLDVGEITGTCVGVRGVMSICVDVGGVMGSCVRMGVGMNVGMDMAWKYVWTCI